MNEDPGTERTEINNDQGAAPPGGLDTDLVQENDQVAAGPPSDARESFPGFLELFYGVLF